MRWIERPPCPAELDGDESPGGTERTEAITLFSDPANSDATFDFEAYRLPSVKAAFVGAFYGKCAYCESDHRATSPIDVEHYRPKSAVEHAGRRRKPGYYWLAATWTNLLPSCNYCNRRHELDLTDGTRRVVGKGDSFPLADESRRAAQPGEEAREDPLLLDPSDEHANPADHLEFFGEGFVKPRMINGVPSRRGETTIEVVALMRLGLANARMAHRIWIKMTVEFTKEHLLDLDRNPDDPEFRHRVERDLKMLRSLLEDDQPYTAMARQEIEPFLADIGAL